VKPKCPVGVDLEKGKQAMQVLTETLNASCLQSTRIVTMAPGKSPASLLSYDDDWRLVLATYHAGAGCTYHALRKTKNPNNWGAIASNFSNGSTTLRCTDLATGWTEYAGLPNKTQAAVSQAIV
jgi:hypothetical protein